MFQDAAGDETALLGLANVHPAPVPNCKSRAADIRELQIDQSADTLVLTLALASLQSLDMRCASLRLDGHSAAYAVSLRVPTEEFISLSGPFEVVARAKTTGVGLDGCVSLYFEDGASRDCLGSFVTSGNEMQWRIPLAGEVRTLVWSDPLGLDAHEETRAYDLRGPLYELHARASVALATTIVRDNLAAGEIVL